MRAILSQLEAILDRLAQPERLSAEEVGFLLRDWDTAMACLEGFPESAAAAALAPGEKLYLRVWLQRILERLPVVQDLLVVHKSDLAKQLFSENRRLKSLNSRYSAEFWGNSRLQQKV
ncbi:MAG: hypothetical protein HQL90_06615 [Magnetococcales bacterium]|nr:hypothetical protein [Magnetococcales bacterium]